MKLLVATILCMAAATGFALRTRDKPESFIINGQDSGVVSFYAYIEIFERSDFKGPMYFGGGSLISSTLILTVAQNVAGFQSWRIGLGANRIPDMEWFYSTYATIHEDYDNNTLANNIAIIRLSESTTNYILIGPVPIISAQSTYPGARNEVLVYGFGFGVENVQPDILQRLQIVVTTQEECEDYYPHLQFNSQNENHFCGRNNTMTSGNICAGDQGGPAFSPNINTLVGIQSFYRVANCSLPDAQPSAYIRIAQYAKWIDSIYRATYGLDSSHSLQGSSNELYN